MESASYGVSTPTFTVKTDKTIFDNQVFHVTKLLDAFSGTVCVLVNTVVLNLLI